EGASLRYGPERRAALSGVDLSLRAGDPTALVGPSGAGKSSVLNALLRFWPLEGGTATAGGVALDAMSQRDARSLFATVDQNVHLFAGTVLDNLVLARPDAPTDDVDAALRAAQLADWVAELPLGLATEIGERGALLSGGQRQRLALARALIAGRPVVLLDEPCAGLDEATADRMLADVLRESSERVVLVITHRAEEARHCSTVLEMRNGRIVDAPVVED
ncbi:MAG: ATP-binding cassette domain-containing protein, partial [Acidimicrobiales bacterium]